MIRGFWRFWRTRVDAIQYAAIAFAVATAALWSSTPWGALARALLHRLPAWIDAQDLPPDPNPNCSKAAWFLDPANSVAGACASDNNNGTQSTCGAAGSNQGPLLTCRQLRRRWGGVCTFAQATTVTGMSSQPANGESDPCDFTVQVRNSGSFQFLGALTATTQTQTGTITVVTSKVRGTSDLAVAAPITALPGGNLLVNATHPSRAINVGATGLVAQPLTGTLSNAALPVEVDTWTTGDSYTAYGQASFNLVNLNCIVSDTVNATPCLVNAISFANPGAQAGGAYESVTVAGPWVISDSAINRSLVSVQGGGHTPALRLIDNYYNGDVAVSGPPPSSLTAALAPNINGAASFSQVPTIFGGNTNGGTNTAAMNLTNVWLDYDIRIMDSTIAVLEGADFYGCVELASSARLRTAGAYVYPLKVGACATNAIIWQPGAGGSITLDGVSRWSYNGGTATATFLGGVALQVNNRGTLACSHSSGSPDVVSCGITISVANLDAAQGAAGFGGLAYLPGGSAYASVP